MSDEGPVDLAHHRRVREAFEKDDSASWSALDALEWAVQRLRAVPEDERPEQLVILAVNPDGTLFNAYAGLDRSSLVFLLELEKQRQLVDAVTVVDP